MAPGLKTGWGLKRYLDRQEGRRDARLAESAGRG